MRLGRLLRHRAFDAVVLALAVFGQVELWTRGVPGPKAAVVPGMLLVTLPLLLRRRFPLAAPASVFAALGALTFADPQAATSTDTTLFALLLAFGIVGAGAEPRQALAGLALGFAAMVVVVERDPGETYAETGGLFLVAGGVWLAAFAAGRWTRRAAELEARAARVERDRASREREAVTAERRRIARDLHDVIAHTVGIMILQAGAARSVLGEPDRARAPVAAVEAAGRQSLGEMRRLLGILRDEDAGAALTPQPGLAQLDALLREARAAGLPAELVVDGEPRALPRGVDLAAYRIVQESLTNTRKHAGPASATVSVRYLGDAVELEIADDGRASADGGSGGHGLVGMRERVRLYGGRFEAGPRAQGGFAVRALLPLAPVDEAPARDRRANGASREPSTVAEAGRVRARALGFRWFDGLVVALAIVLEIELWLGSVPGSKLVTAPAVLLITLPLLLRHRFPFAAPALALLVQAGAAFAGDAVGTVFTWFVAMLLAFWLLGAHTARNQAVAGLAIGLAAIAVVGARDVRVDVIDGVNGVVLAVAAWLAARVIHRRVRSARELERRAGRLEREGERQARVAVAEERSRIARELHDVVAHCVSVMTVQAGAARLLLDDDPGRAREPLLAVEETGRQALAEMRRLLQILRRDTAESGPAPEPGLAELRTLVERCGGAGLPVELAVEGEPETALAPGVDLAAYRVVQEALTNAIKHAGPARAWVTVRYAGRTLELEIADDGRATPKNGGHGHGLVGMRERVALYGGELEAGPRAAGGYAVHARFPLEQP